MRQNDREHSSLYMRVILTKDEYHYLRTFLNNNNIRGVNRGYEDSPILIVNHLLANEIRNFLGEELPNHFDSMYKITKTGSIIESLIDKLYIQ